MLIFFWQFISDLFELENGVVNFNLLVHYKTFAYKYHESKYYNIPGYRDLQLN